MRLKLYGYIKRFLSMLSSPYCHKTEMGYNCHYRVLSNGNKECQ